MLDFYCVARVPGNPAGTHTGSQPRAGDITVAKTVFFTNGTTGYLHTRK